MNFWDGCPERYHREGRLPIREPDDEPGWMCRIDGYCDHNPTNCPMWDQSAKWHEVNGEFCQSEMLHHDWSGTYYCKDCGVFI